MGRMPQLRGIQRAPPMRQNIRRLQMLTRWNTGWGEFDEIFSTMNQLRTYMDRVFEDNSTGRYAAGRPSLLSAGSWPRANLIDSGANLIVTAEVPGLTEKDITLTLNQDFL